MKKENGPKRLSLPSSNLKAFVTCFPEHPFTTGQNFSIVTTEEIDLEKPAFRSPSHTFTTKTNVFRCFFLACCIGSVVGEVFFLSQKESAAGDLRSLMPW